MHIRNFINGEFVDAASGKTFETLNPATGEVLASVAEGGAVEAARRAFDDGQWPRMRPQERARIMNRIADGIERRREEFATLESRDMGKPIRESLNFDLPRAMHNFRFFAEFAELAHEDAFNRPTDLMYVRHEPVGVAVLITPWNFPLMLSSWKVAPAIAFGNTCILKPAEQSPATASLLAEVAAEAGLPPGVLNVLNGFGPGSAGEAITTHPGVDLVSFTGETGTGRAIMAAGAPTLKRVSFELGGKSASIVFDDADLDEAVAGSVDAIYRNSGEVCFAGSRMFVHRPIYEEFMDRFVATANALKVGDPLDPETEVGPVVSSEHLDKVLSYVAVGVVEQGKLLAGGSRVQGLPGELAKGNFVEPTVFGDVTNQMRIAREEIFGPLEVAIPFDTEEEAVAMANDSPYGLAGVVWTQNLKRAHRVAANVNAGTIWINCWFVRDLRVPYGGSMESGIGREGGAYSREFYTETKTVVINLQ